MEGLELGLDISTSVIGIAAIDRETEALKVLEFLKLSKEKNLINKALLFKEFIEKYKDYPIKSISIEAPMKAYKHGNTSAQVISKLATFNGMCMIISMLVFGIPPRHIDVNHARKVALPDAKFPRGSNKKHIVWEHISTKYPKVEWRYGPRSGKLTKENYDMCDAAVVALAGIREPE